MAPFEVGTKNILKAFKKFINFYKFKKFINLQISKSSYLKTKYKLINLGFTYYS